MAEPTMTRMAPCSEARSKCCRDYQPIQTSNVVLLNTPQRGIIPPPSPPTPDSALSLSECDTPEDFSLDEGVRGEEGPAAHERHPSQQSALREGLHVMNTEAGALKSLTTLYATDQDVQSGFVASVDELTGMVQRGGKLVVVGVGKSGLVARKLVATFQSLGIPAVFLHPTEALHGDLGLVARNDTLLLITYSGTTPELLRLLPHLNHELPAILLTSHVRRETCELAKRRPGSILLPAPIPEPEKVSFGVPAPTTSTTTALAVGDALAISTARRLHGHVADVFARNHPGGAIGAAAAPSLASLAVPWSDLVDADVGLDQLGIDLLRVGYESTTGWVRTPHGIVAPGQIRTLSSACLCRPMHELAWLAVKREEMLDIYEGSTLDEARDMLRRATKDAETGVEARRDQVVAVVGRDGGIIGVLEGQQLRQGRN